MPIPTEPTLTLRDLNRALLARQLLLVREKTPAQKAIQRIGGMQAQLPKPPFVGLWSRLVDFRREELLRLVQKHAVVRATSMRGTIHLLTAKDYVRLRPALQTVLTKGMHAVLRDRMKGLDIDALVGAARAVFAAEPCTFTELRAALVKRFPDLDERAMGFVVRMNLPLVQVPADVPWGWPSNADFALADAWVGDPLATDDARAAEATIALVRAYLAAYGPATVADAKAWSGHPGVAAAFEALRGELLVFRDEKKRELFDVRAAPRPPADTPAPVRFLPEFDSALLAHADRHRIISDAGRAKVFFFAARAACAFLVDGFVAGTWKITRTKSKAALVLEPFASLPKATERALLAEAEPLVRFAEPDAASFEARFARA